MTELLMSEPRPKQKGTGRTTTAIQIDQDLARKIAVIASHRGIRQSEVISPVLRDIVEAQYALVSSEIQQELKSRKSRP